MAPFNVQPQKVEPPAPKTVPPKRLKQWQRQLKVLQLKSDPLLISSVLLGGIGLLLTQQDTVPRKTALDPNQFCNVIVQPKAVMSRNQLAQLLTVAERGDRTKVQNIVKEPYCRMANLSLRAGTITERVAYPLDFDSQTWLVIVYEGKTYVGYGFKRS